MRRSAFLVPAALAVACALAACGDDRAPAPRDSTAATVPAPDGVAATAPLVSSGWEPAYGPMLFIAAGGGELEAVPPTVGDSSFADSAAWAGATTGAGDRIELFARAGRVAAVRVAPNTAVRMPEVGDGCISWPALRTLDTVPSQWLAGFAQGHATAIPLDSIETFARADSARAAADAARIASQIPNDTAVAFAGLPFVVRTAYRLRPASGGEVLVADVTRRIGQEADPREQHVFLVAERAAPDAPWRLAWHARTSGPEDGVETRELLAAVELGPTRTPALVVAVTYNEGNSYTLVARDANGAWGERWASAYTGC